MSGLVGADVDQLIALAGRLERQAGEFSRIASSSTGALMVASWTGADIDRVRSEWNRTSRPAILGISTELRQLAIELKRQAEQQRMTSAAGTGRTTRATDTPTRSAIDKLRDYRDQGVAHINKVVGPDGVTRFVVYIDGTHGDPRKGLQELLQIEGWPEALLAGMDVPTLTRLYVEYQLMQATKGYKNPEIMIIGYSQGGDIAQGIANDHFFNVKEVLTIGSPPIMTLNDYGGANVVRLAHNSDEVLQYTAIVNDLASHDLFGPLLKLNAELTALTSGDQSDGSVVTFHDGSADGPGAHDLGHKDNHAGHDYYEQVADDYDRSTDPEIVAARERQDMFLNASSVEDLRLV